jgi:hypothetical protein
MQNYLLNLSARVAPRHVRGRATDRFRSLVFVLTASIIAAALILGPARSVAGGASAPVLLTRANTTRGVALDSVTEVGEPFPPVQALDFSLSGDRRARVMLFATNLNLLPGEDASIVTAEAEDGALLHYPLTVEYVTAVPGFNWMTAVVVRLNDNLGDVGDVLVGLTYNGLTSNRVRIGIGHVGGGPPDDPTASPTPTAVPDLGPGASLHGKRVFPANNPWNQDVSTIPVDSNSANLIASVGLNTGLHADFGTVFNGAPNGIPYVVVAGSQTLAPINYTAYGNESDPGPYPVPPNAPIEGGPGSSGDRHVIVIDRDNWKLYELGYAFPMNNGTSWNANCGAIFDLNSNAQRPAGWTSADAAGLPIFPGLVRYDEVFEQGVIAHALRFTVHDTRRAYVYPASHFASTLTSANLPPMGMRVRLKASFDISGFSPAMQVILRAMKQYGMIVADNGSNWYISGAPDPRWSDSDLHTLGAIKGSNFEVVQMGTIVTK